MDLWIQPSPSCNVSAQNQHINLAQLLGAGSGPQLKNFQHLPIVDSFNSNRFADGVAGLCRLATTCLSNPHSQNESCYFPFVPLALCIPVSPDGGHHGVTAGTMLERLRRPPGWEVLSIQLEERAPLVSQHALLSLASSPNSSAVPSDGLCVPALEGSHLPL